MANNQFVVDLGDMKLTEEQKININAAIQKAVTGQLAHLGNSSKIALFPVGGTGPKFPGPILWGIIARPWKDQWVKELGLETR